MPGELSTGKAINYFAYCYRGNIIFILTRFIPKNDLVLLFW
ncbi:hypothetical protein RintRC_1742 [Richelia intracellularis]|nr:hypothetical protein RintRC_1742 [Richelia intracellularis]